MRLQNQTVLVTGGASGLGGATAEMIVAAGGRAIIADVNEAAGRTAAARLGASARFIRTDVTVEADVQQAIAAAVKEFGAFTGLVNAAGIGPAARVVGRDGPMPLDQFARVIQINLIGTFNAIRLAAAAMQNNQAAPSGERGVIVNTASVAAYDGQIGQAAYSASKGGVVGMTLTIARDLSAVGIRVNTIAPGLIDTPIYGQGEGADAFKEKLKKDVLFPHRLGTSEEFATLAVELATNSYMNGESIRIDGGIRMQPK